MDIRHSTRLAALLIVTSGPLAHTQHYSWNLLSAAWRSTGLRQTDLREVLSFCVAEGLLELHGDEHEASYRMSPGGRAAIAELRGFPWTRWRDSRTLAQLRMRARIPSKDGINRRDSDPMPAAAVTAH